MTGQLQLYTQISPVTTTAAHPRVALLVETSRVFGREFLRGVARYSREHGPWSFHIIPGDYEHAVPKMKQWGGTGIIARIPNEQVAKEILEAGLPTVAIGLTDEQLAEDSPLHLLSEVSSDAAEVTQLVADHLLERRFRHCAYVGSADRGWSSRRELAFQNYLEDKDVKLHVYPTPISEHEQIWEREQSVLADWIEKLPKPIGLFACDDDRGREVLEACSIAGCRVPEDVAVVGVDNDDVFCELSDPPLSSVSLNVETSGYRAAELLDGLMSGRIEESRNVNVEALGVVTRRSSDIVAIEDPEIASALRIIHRNHGRDATVDKIVNELAVSRRSLEKRFRATLDRTILDEIQQAKLDHSKRLLNETSHSISKVAKLAGFGSAGYFIQFFQQRVGKTPGQYRSDLSA